LNYDDGVRLYGSRDIHEIGRLANIVRERLHGDAAFYNVNLHVNYSNYCVLRCKFCSFYRPYAKDGREKSHGPMSSGDSTLGLPLLGATSEDSYEYSVDEIVSKARQAYDGGASEVHIVGGLHPKLPFDFYLDMCRAIREACPTIHIKAFTAIEIIHF